jgi:uncharacterized protein
LMSTEQRERRRIAMVTGASSGIGKAFAERLAGQRWDLVLVARDGARLRDLAERLKTQHGTESEVMEVDLIDPEQRAKVEARLRGGSPSVEMLVNNAGFGTGGAFSEVSIEGEERVVQLNVVALMRLAHAALEPMRRQGRGTIINVSSVAGFAPGSLNATYSASKAFVTNFTETLSIETRGTGIRVQALCPGFTRTEFQQRAGIDDSRLPGFVWDSADTVVEASLRGLARRQVVVMPTFKYQLLVALIKLLPRGFVRFASGIVGRQHRPKAT